jgi:hypothetical protein
MLSCALSYFWSVLEVAALGGLSGRVVLGKSFGCTYLDRFAPFVGALPALFTSRLVLVVVRPALFSDRLAFGGRFGLFDVPLLALRAFTRRSEGGAYLPPSLAGTTARPVNAPGL